MLAQKLHFGRVCVANFMSGFCQWFSSYHWLSFKEQCRRTFGDQQPLRLSGTAVPERKKCSVITGKAPVMWINQQLWLWSPHSVLVTLEGELEPAHLSEATQTALNMLIRSEIPQMIKTNHFDVSPFAQPDDVHVEKPWKKKVCPFRKQIRRPALC